MNIVVLFLLGLQLRGLHSFLCIKTRFANMDGATILPLRTYMKLGDINVGVLFPISFINKDGTACLDKVRPGHVERKPDVIAYAVENFNRRSPLPNNLTLGFVILDDCGTLTGSVVQSLKFLPTTCEEFPKEYTTQLLASHTERFDVVALICCHTSIQTTAVAKIMTSAKIPQISVSPVYGSSDESSYLFNTVSTHKMVDLIIVKIMKKYDWNYASVIYADECEGKENYRRLKTVFQANGICVASAVEVERSFSEKQIYQAAKSFMDNRGRSRVVIILTMSEKTFKLVGALSRMVKRGTLLWIAVLEWEAYALVQKEAQQAFCGSFLISIRQGYYPPFDIWFQNLKPNTTSDTWFADNWEDHFQCSLREKTCGDDLSFANTSLPLDIDSGRVGYIMDAVSLIGTAVSSILKSSDCNALDPTRARKCLRGPKLYSQLTKTTLHGVTGVITFENGNREMPFYVKQIRQDSTNKCEAVTILEYSSITEELTEVSQVNWNYFNLGDLDHLDSQCSVPCGLHDIMVPGEPSCCWECVSCYKHQIVVDNGTKCEPCPRFTWPDKVNRQKCVPIAPAMLTFRSEATKVALDFFCICICLLVFAFFCRHKNHQVIKASSIHLSNVMLFAIICGCITNLVFTSEVSSNACRAGFSLLGLSFTLLYGPLLLRTVWIYRLFQSGQKTIRRPFLTSKSHQLILCLVLLAIDGAIQVGPYTDPTYKWWEKQDRGQDRAYVEITCRLPTRVLAVKMVYYGGLIASCGCLAYKSRNLPHKFNESWFISICVFTILAISTGFIPIYFASERNIQKMRVIVTFVFLNHSVALVFLFMTKVYMVMFISERKMTTISRKKPPHMLFEKLEY